MAESNVLDDNLRSGSSAFTQCKDKDDRVLYLNGFIRPIHSGIRELYVNQPYHSRDIRFTADSCCKFIADHVYHDISVASAPLPSHIQFPGTTISKHKGNIFDLAVLQCSLLRGVGYDSYCVAGRRRAEAEHREAPSCAEEKNLLRFISSRQSAVSGGHAREAIPEAEPPVCVSCWILIREGKRGVSKSIFVDPFSAEEFPMDQPESVSSVWNDSGVWVSRSSQGKSVNLSDDFEKVNTSGLPPPASLREPIIITDAMVTQRFPDGVKTELFARSDRLRYSKFAQTDGLIETITRYANEDKLHVVRKWEKFHGRIDGLITRLCVGDVVVEQFAPQSRQNGVSTVIVGNQYSEIRWRDRIDGLMRSVYTDGVSFIEEFMNRDDGMVSHRVVFGSEPSKLVIDGMFVQRAEVDYAEGKGGKVVFDLLTGETSTSGHALPVKDMQALEKSIHYVFTDNYFALQAELQKRAEEEMRVLTDIEPLLKRSIHEKAIDVASKSTLDDLIAREADNEGADPGAAVAVGLEELMASLLGPESMNQPISKSTAAEVGERFRARQNEKGRLIQLRLTEEQEKLRSRRAMIQRRGNDDINEMNEFDKYQAIALFRISILEQRMARHEIESVNRLKEVEEWLQNRAQSD